MKSRKLREVGLKEIDSGNTATAFSFQPDAEKLAASLKRAGLLYPVYLAHEKGLLRPVCGHRRLKTCAGLGIDRVPAFILHPGPQTRTEALLFNVVDNSLHRSLNMVEISNVLFKLSGWEWEEKRIIREAMPVLGQASNKRIYRDYLSLQELIPEFKAYLVETGTPLRPAKRLAHWGEEDQKTLFLLIQTFRPGANKLRALLELVEEISLREKVSPGQVLRKLPRVSRDLSPADKARKVRALLWERRYPDWSGKREGMNRELKKLALPKGARLAYPENFEGDALTLSLRFSSVEELFSQFDAIKSGCGEQDLERILKLLQE